MILFFDNGGKTWDRYTMYQSGTRNGEKIFYVYGFSMNALEADGFNQFSHEANEINAEIGNQIDFDELPLSVQRAVLGRLSND